MIILTGEDQIQLSFNEAAIRYIVLDEDAILLRLGDDDGVSIPKTPENVAAVGHWFRRPS